MAQKGAGIVLQGGLICSLTVRNSQSYCVARRLSDSIGDNRVGQRRVSHYLYWENFYPSRTPAQKPGLSLRKAEIGLFSYLIACGIHSFADDGFRREAIIGRFSGIAEKPSEDSRFLETICGQLKSG